MLITSEEHPDDDSYSESDIFVKKEKLSKLNMCILITTIVNLTLLIAMICKGLNFLSSVEVLFDRINRTINIVDNLNNMAQNITVQMNGLSGFIEKFCNKYKSICS